MFTRPDGHPYYPNYFTHRFRYLIAHTAGADLKTVQDQLGHASIVLTADTYTSVLPATHHYAAEATARLVLTTARGLRTKITRTNKRRRPAPAASTSATPTPASTSGREKAAGQRRDQRKKRARKH